MPPTPDDRRSRVPLGLLGALAIIAAIEGGPGGSRPTDRASKPALACRFGASAATDEGAIGAEVLCLGDSRIKLGVLPAVLGKRLGCRSYNLAVPGAQAAASAFLLGRAIEAGARPRVVVVGFDENLLAVSPREGLGTWPELLTARDWLDLARRGRDPDLAVRVGLAMVLPSWRDRGAIREEILAATTGTERPILPELRALERNWRRNLGAQVATPGERVPSALPPPGGGGSGRTWKPHPVNAAYVHRLCDLAERHGIAVAWLLPPGRPDWHARREAIGLVGPFDRFVDAVQAAHPGLVVVDARSAGFPDSAFRDTTHLDGLGAVALSEGLAEALRPLLDAGDPGGPASRRVALRAFEAPSTAVAMEDMAQSLAASAAETSRRRR